MLTSIFQRQFQNGKVIALNLKPRRAAWGGGNQFAAQLKNSLEEHGYVVRHDLNGPTDLIFLGEPRRLGLVTFGVEEIEEFRRKNPRVKVMHRVNECDQRKGTSDMDPILERANQCADYTVFNSEWLARYHAKWHPAKKPQCVIYNGADTRIYHPLGGARWDGKEPLRVVTHHWSDNELKGFDAYEQLDSLIANGELPGFEFHVIGRWPSRIKWRVAKTFGPCHGVELASKIRACHLYLTASRWEPCGNHQVEGVQCGLPLIYHLDSGGTVEAGERYGVPFRDDLAGSLRQARDEYTTLRRKVFDSMPSGSLMCMEYLRLIQRLLAE